MAAGEVATSEREAVTAAEKSGLPVALKRLSREVTHRAAAGLLAVDLRSTEEVIAAYRRLMARARDLDVVLDGMYVQHMVPGGLELLVSVFRDQLFGTMLACGAGGNLTEMVDDVAIARAPVDEALALDLLGRLRIARYAQQQSRGLDPRNPVGFITRFSRLAATAPWRQFVLEVNPVKWIPDGAVAVDALLIIEQP